MIRYTRCLLAVVAFSVSAPGVAVHFPGHGLDAETSQQQLDEFCNKRYPEIRQSPQYTIEQKQEAEKLYKQHCRKQPDRQPAQKPIEPSKPEMVEGRIDRVEGPSCISPGSEVRVQGRDLRRGDLRCTLVSKGRRQGLRAYSRTEQEFRFRLEDPLVGPDYGLECEVAGDRDRIRLNACPAPEEQADGTDLAPEIGAGALRPGETQTVEVSVINRGRSQPGNRRHRLVLVLADRDLSRTGLRTMSSALSPAAGQVLAHKRQWVMRVPGPGGSERVPIAMTVPARLPDGEILYWCALVDSDDKIPEVNEGNNLECVPASDGQKAVARDDLSKLFGSAVRKQQPVAAQIDTDRLQAGRLAVGVTPAALEMVLKVNDSFGFPPVSVPAAGPMQVSWAPLPEAINGFPVVGITVRFREGADFPANDCSGGPDTWSGDLPVAESWDWPVGGSRSFEVDLTQTDAAGERIFNTGYTYYVKGCLLVERDGLARYIDDPDINTNSVPVTYGLFDLVSGIFVDFCAATPAEGVDTELEILRVDGERTVSGFHFFELAVLIRNNGDQAATVRAAYLTNGISVVPANRRGLETEYIVGQRAVTIAPGDTEIAHVLMKMPRREMMERYPETFDTTVFIYNDMVPLDEEDLARARWRDSNICDDGRQVSFSMAEPEQWQVRVELARVRIVDNCDHVSPGDWFFELGACAMEFDHSNCTIDRYQRWPDRALDLNAGDEIIPGVATYTRAPRTGSKVKFVLKGWECDTASYTEHAGVCAYAEEFPEIASGGTAFGGTTQGEYPYSWWDPGWSESTAYVGDRELPMPEPNNVGYRSYNNCGDGAYEAWIKISAQPYWPG